MLELPAIILLQQDRADEPSNTFLVLEYTNNISAAFDLLVETFKRFG